VRSNDLTVVYYSASTEAPSFEARVQAQILAAGGGALPIISVTQKPADFGRNICVGDVGCCDANAYFEWHPDASTQPCVRYEPIYILWNRHAGHGGGFWRKEWTEGAQYVRTEFLLKRLDRALAGRSVWSTPADPHPPELFRKRRWGYRTEPAAPVISCKTGQGLRWRTGVIRGRARVPELPYWGAAEAVGARFFRGETS
jgi:hypothetical protein